MKIETRFTTIQDVGNFVAIAQKSLDEVWVTKPKSRICIDGKSLMGMFSIDTTSKFYIETKDDEVAGYIMTHFPDVSSYVD